MTCYTSHSHKLTISTDPGNVPRNHLRDMGFGRMYGGVYM